MIGGVLGLSDGLRSPSFPDSPESSPKYLASPRLARLSQFLYRCWNGGVHRMTEFRRHRGLGLGGYMEQIMVPGTRSDPSSRPRWREFNITREKDTQ